MERLNAEVLLWADDYARWRQRAAERGEFPNVITVERVELTEEQRRDLTVKAGRLR
jgi:hypothetical protein